MNKIKVLTLSLWGDAAVGTHQRSRCSSAARCLNWIVMSTRSICLNRVATLNEHQTETKFLRGRNETPKRGGTGPGGRDSSAGTEPLPNGETPRKKSQPQKD